MLQWCYLNARLDAAFAAQEEHASHALYDVWSMVLDKRRACMTARKDIRRIETDNKLASALGALVT